MVVSNIFYFHPYLGKIFNLTKFFHQPDQYVLKNLAGMPSLIREISHTVRPLFYSDVTNPRIPSAEKCSEPLVVDRLVANAQAVEIHS